jgi:hypothetical protein
MKFQAPQGLPGAITETIHFRFHFAPQQRAFARRPEK